MLLTREFKKALIATFILAILLFGLNLFMQYYRLTGFSTSGENSPIRIILNISINAVESLCIWMAIAYITKEKLGSMIALLMQLSILGYTFFQLQSNGIAQEVFDSIYWVHQVVYICSYVVFGLIHFKHWRGIFMLAYWFAMIGISIAMYADKYYDFLNGLLRILDLEDLLEWRIPAEGGGYRPINLFQTAVRNLDLPVRLMVFWFVFTKIKFPQLLNASLTIVPLTSIISKGLFSIIYWILRIALFAAGLGVLGFLTRSMKTDSPLETAYRIACFCLGIFMLASMYRNFLTAYFISKGRYPGWLYWLLNIPVLHIAGWIIALFLRPKIIAPQPPMETADGPVDQPLLVSKAHELQHLFSNYSSKNGSIKIILIILLFLVLLIPLHQMGFSIPGIRPSTTTHLLTFGLISFALSIWYLYDWKALTPLFIIQSAGLIFLGYLHDESMISPKLTFGFVNMVVYYALFHFDHLQFIDGDSVNFDVIHAQDESQ